jgi:hypothetical protein
LNVSSAVSSSISSVEEYWSSQTAKIQLSLDLKYGAVGRKAAMQATSGREKALVAGISGAVADAEIIIFGRDAVCRVVLLVVARWNRPPARRE